MLLGLVHSFIKPKLKITLTLNPAVLFGKSRQQTPVFMVPHARHTPSPYHHLFSLTRSINRLKRAETLQRLTAGLLGTSPVSVPRELSSSVLFVLTYNYNTHLKFACKPNDPYPGFYAGSAFSPSTRAVIGREASPENFFLVAHPRGFSHVSSA